MYPRTHISNLFKRKLQQADSSMSSPAPPNTWWCDDCWKYNPLGLKKCKTCLQPRDPLDNKNFGSWTCLGKLCGNFQNSITSGYCAFSFSSVWFPDFSVPWCGECLCEEPRKDAVQDAELKESGAQRTDGG
jgi:hypothetical protein